MGNPLLTALVALLLTNEGLVTAAKHHLIASSFQTKHLHALTYDDITNALTLDRRTTTLRAGHASLALNRARTALYASQRGGWSSYAVPPPPSTEVRMTGMVKLNDTCLGAEAKRGSTVLAASPAPPFMVYGVGKSPCGAVLSVAGDGSIGAAVQGLDFRPRSKIQGLAVHPSGGALFAADNGLNSVWVRPLDGAGRVGVGKVVRVPLPNSGVGDVLVHPGGRYLYVLLRRRVQIAVFEIVSGPGREMDLRYTNTTISLLPKGFTPRFYKAAAMQLSADGRVLFGTVKYPPRKVEDDSDSDNPEPRRQSILRRQYRPAPPTSPAAPPYGFLTATLLSAPPRDPAQTGFPLQLLLHVSTTTSGGQSNAVSPAPWSRAHLALADSERARVQVWRVDGLAGALPTGGGGGGGGGAAGARDVLSEEALRRVRANIVAEWQAPREDVGVAERDRAVGAGVARRQATNLAAPWAVSGAAAWGGRAGAQVPVGRGCCADVVWLD